MAEWSMAVVLKASRGFRQNSRFPPKLRTSRQIAARDRIASRGVPTVPYRPDRYTGGYTGPPVQPRRPYWSDPGRAMSVAKGGRYDVSRRRTSGVLMEGFDQ